MESPENFGRLQEALWRFQKSSGKVAGGSRSSKPKLDKGLVMILHSNAARNRQGPVLRLAGLRARTRPGAVESFLRLKINSRRSQTLPETPRSSQKQPGARKIETYLFLKAQGGSWWPQKKPRTSFEAGRCGSGRLQGCSRKLQEGSWRFWKTPGEPKWLQGNSGRFWGGSGGSDAGLGGVIPRASQGPAAGLGPAN